VELVLEKFRTIYLLGLYGLVNNAGIVGNVSFDDWLLVQDYQDVFDVNTLGVIRVTHAFKDLIKKTKYSNPLVTE
jgi:NAD(P)-dependent dehydrogenase (short-subunit alcohol dehydrogenase family)